MKFLKQYPFFLLLFVLFFCLHGAVENFGHISIKETSFIGISVLLQLIICFIFIFLFVRNLIFTSLITFYVAVFYFFFGVFQDRLIYAGSTTFLGKYSVLIPLFFILLFGLFFWLKKIQSYWPKIVLFFNVLFLIYNVFDLYELVRLNQKKEIKPLSVDFDYDKVSQKPNVYFLLFDGYPSYKILKDSFNYENNDFTTFLSTNNFISLPISSNYDDTQYSMSSTLNMNYIYPKYDLKFPTQQEFQKRQKEISKAVVFDIFERMGYELENNSIFDVHNLPSISSENSFLLANGILLTDKIFINRINKDMGRIIPLSVVKWLPFLQNKSIYRDMDNNNNIEKKLLSKVRLPNAKPFFNYAHFILPHTPFYYDSLGVQNNNVTMENKSDSTIKREFVSYVKYTNNVIKKVTSHLIEQNPNSIVIILSDHGHRTYNHRGVLNKQSRLQNIGAVHFPNKNWGNLPDTITNVNFFRYLFNTQFSQNLMFVKDSTFQ